MEILFLWRHLVAPCPGQWQMTYIGVCVSVRSSIFVLCLCYVDSTVFVLGWVNISFWYSTLSILCFGEILGSSENLT